MAACFVEDVEGLGRCLVAGRDFEPGEEILMEAPLLAADASDIEADLADADLAIEAEEAQPWSRVKVDAAAVRRLRGLLQAYARSEPEVKRAVLELDDAMEAGAPACLVRKLAALLSEGGYCPRMRKMELHCVLSPICPHAVCHVPMFDVECRHCCVVSLRAKENLLDQRIPVWERGLGPFPHPLLLRSLLPPECLLLPLLQLWAYSEPGGCPTWILH